MDGGDIPKGQEEAYASIGYGSISAIVKAISVVSSTLILEELKRLMQDQRIAKAAGRGLMPYIYAAGFLSFAGREITRESLSGMVSVMGIKPDKDLIEILMEAGVKNHLVYVHAFYYILASGQNPTYDEMAKVLKGIGIEPDRMAVEETMSYIRSINASKASQQ